MDLISICIPTYNGADFLQECLDSALAQTHTAIEILIVDDCSGDATLEIAQAAARRDPRIRVERNDSNLGLVGNWNRCVELARGEWIKFLFQDDLISPDCLQTLLAEAQSQGRRMVACERDFLFDDTISEMLRTVYGRNQALIHEVLAPQRGISAAAYATRILRRINNNYVGEPTVTLLHRDLFKDHGLFNPEIAQLCDVEYWSRIISHEGLAFVPRRLATFRAHGQATSALNRSELKAFRATGLDNLAMLDDMLRLPVYQRLREHWRDAGLLATAQQQHHERCNEVLEHVRRRRRRDPALQQQFEREYHAFLQRHPGCRLRSGQHRRWLLRALPLRYKFQLGQWLNPLLPKALKRGRYRPL